jgi:hypothetical protein
VPVDVLGVIAFNSGASRQRNLAAAFCNAHGSGVERFCRNSTRPEKI